MCIRDRVLLGDTAIWSQETLQTLYSWYPQKHYHHYWKYRYKYYVIKWKMTWRTYPPPNNTRVHVHVCIRPCPPFPLIYPPVIITCTHFAWVEPTPCMQSIEHNWETISELQKYFCNKSKNTNLIIYKIPSTLLYSHTSSFPGQYILKKKKKLPLFCLNLCPTQNVTQSQKSVTSKTAWLSLVS